ncbi:MAG: sigma-70 family RNA polymerase sigma factor [Bacteroidales bacterium]|nr:sigma-70 family RNA polymerase sigma factor [Candidatus Colimorpha merdihippi]
METSQQSEKAQRDYLLVRAAREQGDQRAYADLMKFYRDPIYLMMLKMTRNPADADDLTIETFGNAFSQLDNYSPKHAFSTWLFAIASNKGIDFIRRRHMDTVSLSSISVNSEDEAYEYPLPSHDNNPEESMIGQQSGALLKDVVNQLPARYRTIVNMRYYDELSYDEIATKLNMPMGTVKIQLRRARQLLAQLIETHHKHSL